MAEERKRELALPPGTYAYVLDSTKGSVKLYVGATVINQTGQDRPVKFNTQTFKFDECTLEEALQQTIVVPEGFYAVLTNPAFDKNTRNLIYPNEGTPAMQDLTIGQKVNVSGPANFALYPGQMCEVRRGHHLRSNEYIRIKIYNEEKARENWSKAVVKAAETPEATVSAPKTKQVPADLAVGKQYNILGTEVAFYMPPTGVSVIPEAVDEAGRSVFVRQAETLEALEYSILVDEDGNKEYPKGPRVVFPEPTQRFLYDSKGNRKFRAVEMNELQGIQLKFMTDVSITHADGTRHQHKAGEEVFITGKEMPIYYPEEGHQLVKYDGKTIHYAVAVPEGEARYVMDRKTGNIRTVRGPTMLLPNPVDEIIVRRALTDGESVTWFPGSDGKGSQEALAYNQWLRAEATKEPTTRSGVVSEGRIGESGAKMDSMDLGGGGFDALELAQMAYSVGAVGAVSNSLERGGSERLARTKSATKGLMPESRQGKNQDAMVGDVAERKSTFNEPRMITFANKYKGVPTIKVRQGYAVQVAKADGSREVVEGPRTKLLDWSETLDVLALSTEKPKNTDKLFRTAYLNVYNNVVTDIIALETVDLVKVVAKLSYRVSFEGDRSKWFSIENYVKHLCDRVRSMMKGKVRKLTIEAFYKNSTDIIRDAILGVAAISDDPKGAKTHRPGLRFEENGMLVTDVEVLGVDISDVSIAQLLGQQQHQVVQQNITLAQLRSRLEATKETEQLSRAELEAKSETVKRKFELQTSELAEQIRYELSKLATALQVSEEQAKVKESGESIANFAHDQQLGREKKAALLRDEVQRLERADYEARLRSQTEAVVAQMGAIDPALVAALDSVSSRETLVQVAEKLSFHTLAGSKNAVEFMRDVFKNTPLQAIMAKVLERAGTNGNGAGLTPPPIPARPV